MSDRARGPSSPDKLLWPEAGVTKQDLWSYYTAAADRLLPHLADRPLTLKRFPDGVHGQGFFQKNLPDSAPEHLGRFVTHAESSKRDVTYPVARTVEDLQWCAQVAALELHPWFSRIDLPERPDTLAFDLDPSDDGPDEAADRVPAATAALWLREVLDGLGLAGRVKTSGKRGLHVYVPIERRYSFEEVRGFGLGVARCCAAVHPDDLTVEMRKARRGGKLLLDWSRNGPAQTLVAAWSPRATPRATVSMPLDWGEVTDALDPGRFTVRTALDRGDRWAAQPAPQRLERARATLQAGGYDCADRNPRGTAPFA
jgi:bifunctional non-homologous end joining protein LigD